MVEVAADEDKPAFAFFVVFPGPLMIALDDHMDALDDIALVIVAEGENALEAQDIRALFLGDLLHPWEEFVGIEFAGTQGDRNNRCVVNRRGMIMVVMVIMPPVIMPMVVMMMRVIMIMSQSGPQA